jgi:hypothetical protein
MTTRRARGTLIFELVAAATGSVVYSSVRVAHGGGFDDEDSE